MASKKYTEEMIEFIRQHSSEAFSDELAEMFFDEFDIQISKDSLHWIRKEYGIKGRKNFVKGVCPHKNTKYKIGDECFLAGEWRVITSTEQGVSILNRSEYKKRVIWQEAYGEIPEKHCFVYLDGDKRNCTLENLALVPIMWMRILNQNGWLTGNKEVTQTAIEWCRLHYSLSRKEGNRYVKLNGSRYR